MRVCHLINSLEHGGAENHLLEMARANQHVDTDLELTVCCFEEAAPLTDSFLEIGVDVKNFGATFKFDPRAVFRLWQFLSDRDFDILHTHLPLSHAIGRPIARLAGVDTVASTQHNVFGNYHPITGTLEKLTRPLDTRTVAVSKGVRRSFSTPIHHTDPNWEIIHNGIDVEGYTETVEAADPAKIRDRWNITDELVLLNIARYQPEKAQRDLIIAMDEVVDEIPDVKLLMVGSGPLEEELRRQVRKRGLESNVTLTGHVPSVPEYYALADVFVSSSIREGLPITFLEAMAAKLPIVGTAIPGVDELVVEGETGFLVPPESPRELARCLCEGHRAGAWTALGEAGFERARTQFDISRTLDAHYELYSELLDGSRRNGPTKGEST